METKYFEGPYPGKKKFKRPSWKKEAFPRKKKFKKASARKKKFVSDIFSGPPRSLMVEP